MRVSRWTEGLEGDSHRARHRPRGGAGALRERVLWASVLAAERRSADLRLHDFAGSQHLHSLGDDLVARLEAFDCADLCSWQRPHF